MHLSERYANDGDAENETVEYMGKPDSDAAHEEPQHIHEYAQTTWLWWFPLHFRAERPDGQHAQLHALQAKRYSDDGYHQHQSGDEILQGYVQAPEYDTDDVS